MLSTASSHWCATEYEIAVCFFDYASLRDIEYVSFDAPRLDDGEYIRDSFRFPLYPTQIANATS